MAAGSSSRSPPVDRLSQLPDSLLCQILSLVETKVAVSTSVLSIRWKFVWTGLTDLEFHCGGDGDPNSNFAPFVTRVLSNNAVISIQKFLLQWYESEFDGQLINVNEWISLAISKNVQFLTVQLNPGPDYDISGLEIPDALFISGTLETLELNFMAEFSEFILQTPSHVCLPRLEVLNLFYLTYETDDCIGSIIAGCPVLQSLNIQGEGQDPSSDFIVSSSSSLRDLTLELYCDPQDFSYNRTLVIDVPNLEHLVLQDIVTKEYSVTRFHSLNTASLDFWELDLDYYYDMESVVARCNSVVRLLETLSSVEVLELKGSVMVALHHATTTLSTYFKRLTKLSVNLKCCSWSFLNVLIGHSIKLQVLNINMDDCGKEDEDHHELCWEDPDHVPECLSSTLASISFKFLQGREDEIAMLKYVLKHGVVLKSVKLSHNFLHMREEIPMLPRLSKDCSIEF